MSKERTTIDLFEIMNKLEEIEQKIDNLKTDSVQIPDLKGPISELPTVAAYPYNTEFGDGRSDKEMEDIDAENKMEWYKNYKKKHFKDDGK